MTIALEPTDTGIRRVSRNAARIAAERGVPVLDVVIPVYNEQAALADSVRRLHRHLREQFPFTFRITIADNASTDATPAIAAAAGRRARTRCGSCRWSRRAAAGRCTPSGRLGRAGAGLHGRRPVHRPGRAAAAGRPADLRPLRPRHRHPAARGSRVVRGPKREFISRCYNLILRSTLAARFSDAQCGFKAIRADVAQRCCRWSRTPAGSSTPSCWCWPSAAACASTRCRSTGSTTPTAGSTSSPPRSPTSRAWPGCSRASPTGEIPVGAIARPVRHGPDAARPRSLLRQGVRFAAIGVAQHPGLPAAVPGCCGLARRPGRQPGRPAGDRGRQHRRQPPVHLRRAGPHRRRAAPVPGVASSSASGWR